MKKKHLFMDTFCMEYGGEENNKKDLKRVLLYRYLTNFFFVVATQHPYIQKYEL